MLVPGMFQAMCPRYNAASGSANPAKELPGSTPMSLPRIVRWAYWLLTLPFVAALLVLINPWLQLRYDDRGFGTFYGHVRGNFYSSDGLSYFHFEGCSAPVWMWEAPSNYVYPAVETKWGSTRDGTGGCGRLLLPSMTLESDGKRTPWTEDRLHDLMVSSNDRVAKGNQTADVHCLYELIQAAGNGCLPRPRHHPYYFGKAIKGDLIHFSLGLRFPYSLCYWAGTWAIVTTLLMWRISRSRTAE